jgi:hypothetical protein
MSDRTLEKLLARAFKAGYNEHGLVEFTQEALTEEAYDYVDYLMRHLPPTVTEYEPGEGDKE